MATPPNSCPPSPACEAEVCTHCQLQTIERGGESTGCREQKGEGAGFFPSPFCLGIVYFSALGEKDAAKSLPLSVYFGFFETCMQPLAVGRG